MTTASSRPAQLLTADNYTHAELQAMGWGRMQSRGTLQAAHISEAMPLSQGYGGAASLAAATRRANHNISTRLNAILLRSCHCIVVDPLHMLLIVSVKLFI